MRRVAGIVLFAVFSAALFAYSLRPGAVFDWTQALGFITGALGVWLTVYENVWNFPVGIANSVFLAVLFVRTRLFADAGLQVMFILLGFHGWYLWLFGGARRTELPVTRANLQDGLIAVVLCAVGIPLLHHHLVTIQDSAPFWDAVITVLSVVAQILLNRKRIENWFVWIAVDVISIALYVAKAIPLIAILYVLFLGLCVLGYRSWRKALLAEEPAVA